MTLRPAFTSAFRAHSLITPPALTSSAQAQALFIRNKLRSPAHLTVRTFTNTSYTTSTSTTATSSRDRKSSSLPSSPILRPSPTPARALSDDPAPLPPGYTFYPFHSDRPDTPRTMANIIASPHTPPPLPRSSVFDYLFPPPAAAAASSSTSAQKGQTETETGTGTRTVYYRQPDPSGVAFIDGLTGDQVTRGQVEQQALKLAAGLRRLGVKEGEVGMTFGFNSLHYVNAIMGMQAAGCIVSPANAA